MQLSDFDFDLPSQLIARHPLSARNASRLLCVDAATNSYSHHQFQDVLRFLQPGDLLVFNDTKVIPARLFAQKKTGGLVELLVERILDDQRMLAQVRASKAPHVGDCIFFPDGLRLQVVNRVRQFYELALLDTSQTILEVIEAIGQIPLPPYMQREPDEHDKERYQTVYAKHKGSVAAPTAGFHFDEELLERLRQKQIEMTYLTLHIGAGTFVPVRVENIAEHQMHAEYLEVPEEVCRKVMETKAAGHRVIAVGTTSLRALETASQSGTITPYKGETNIFIYPGYQFKSADVLITNLHLPRSTLLMLVSAFGGHKLLMHAYREAVSNAYRFYSYGDAMWITRARV